MCYGLHGGSWRLKLPDEHERAGNPERQVVLQSLGLLGVAIGCARGHFEPGRKPLRAVTESWLLVPNPVPLKEVS